MSRSQTLCWPPGRNPKSQITKCSKRGDVWIIGTLNIESYLGFGIWCLVFFSLLLIHNPSTSQTQWYKYPGNPVFLPGKSGDWDQGLGDQTIIYDSGIYRMWYIGRDWSFEYGQVGYATSTDGIHWEKYEGNPLKFSCQGESWEDVFMAAEIMKKDSVYYMWYSGIDSKHMDWNIGFAWSADGLSWTKLHEPVLRKGNKEDWDGLMAGFPRVRYEGQKYHMWYVGGDNEVPSTLRIGYATSNDGIHWIKHPRNPVMDVGESGSWDDGRIEMGDIRYNGSFYEMWYSGYNYIRFEIGYATSLDGVHWSKYQGNPIIKTGDLGMWDTWDVGVNSVLARDSIYNMWYEGISPGMRSVKTGFATTSEGLAGSWKKADIKKSHRIIVVMAFNRAEYIDPDSLEQVLPSLTGEIRIDTYNKLALAWSLNDNKKSLEYAKKALELSVKENYPKGKALACYSIGISNYIMDDWAQALSNHLVALRLFDSLDMYHEYADLLCQIASIHNYTGSHDLAARYFKQALGVYEKVKDSSSILTTMYYLGYSLLDNEDTMGAKQTFYQRLSLARERNDINRIRSSYAELGRCYYGETLDSSLKYYMKAQEILDSFPSSFAEKGYNLLLSGEAIYSFGPGYYKETEKYFDSCYLYYRIDGRINRIRLLYDMADLYFRTGRYLKAKEYLDNAEEMSLHFLSKHEHQMYMTLTGKLEAEVFLKKYIEKIYHLHYCLDTTLHEEKSALKHLLLATQWRDSIYNEQNRKKISMMQGRYDTETTQNQISMLEKENEMKDLRIRQTRIIMFGMGGFIIMIGLMATLFILQNKIRAEHKTVLLEQKLLRLQMNPHFIFNALSNILNLINRNNNPMASKYLTRFSKLLRNTLEGSRYDTIKLDAEINGLINYLELQKLRFGDKFDFQIHVDETIDTENTIIPPLLVQPFIENAIEHGIKYKKNKGHVFLRFLAKENLVLCEVEDDGVGREKAWELEYSENRDHKSLATTIIKERIQNLNKNLTKKIQFKIIDLKSEDNIGIGTKVVIGIPR